jgi:signal transduction histidine kinase
MADEGVRAGATEELKRLSKALHDICQPLTTLQCRLELAGVLGTDASYREAVEQGLVECARLMDAVERMRELVRAAAQRADTAAI